jgi:hypothetical protein
LVPNRPAKGLSRTVALGELVPLVPSAWRRSAAFVPEQTIVLPPEARLDMGVERPLAFSLRYLAKAHPQWFRDPGPYETDLGVDLWMEPLRDPEAAPAEMDIPAEIIGEAAEERETFLEWEGEKRSPREKRSEQRETEKVLRTVKMPPLTLRTDDGFEDLLRTPAPTETPLPEQAANPDPAPAPQPAPAARQEPNPRLRKILEAYANNLTGSSAAPSQAAAESLSQSPLRQPAEAPVEPQAPVRWGQAVAKAAPAAPLEVATTPGEGSYQMRFEELGLSLSKFAEVRGFGFWQGAVAQHTGELGFDARNAAARETLERILDGALATQGPRDGFLSVTVHHAHGGISVFGGGPCLVAVAHHADGLPSHLRSWLCGWVSQPLRS